MYHDNATSELTVGDMIASGAYHLILGIESAYRAVADLLRR
ncbi:MAG: hypothetical protein VW338_18160 [Rhodospirillaceae bacterium]